MHRNFNPNKHSLFEPKFKHKYMGETPIIIRSSYEEAFARWLDNNSRVIAWSSEPIAINYVDPVKNNKNRRYYPDFILKIKDGKKEKIFIVEIKPEKDLRLPKSRNKTTRIKEMATLSTNMAKWKAANNLCKRNGWSFKIITEKELFRE